jgi:DnaK suppressor protein
MFMLTCYNDKFGGFATRPYGRRVRKVDRKVAQKRKKTTRKKSRTSTARKRRLTPAEIERFQRMLLQKRREIVGDVNEMEDEALKKPRLDATGNLSSMPIHMADLGSDNYEQEFALGLMDSERKLLREIDDALQRIERRVYGICEGTGKPIPKARLQAQPWARYCVEYARMLEQGYVRAQEEPVLDLGEGVDLEGEQ